MRTVNVNKAELLASVTANRDGHRTQFEEALDGWYKAVIKRLEQTLDNAKANKIQDVRIILPRPSDHTSDYDRVIEMLKMSVDDVVQLTETEFAQFVQDDWGWKDQWLVSNSSYSSSIYETASASGLIND